MRPPLTDLGRWSLLSTGLFVVCIAIFIVTVSAGQRGGEGFFDSLWLTVPFLAAYVAAVGAFVFGAVAMIAFRERSVSVIGSTLLGLLVTTFGVLEVVVPH